MLFITYPLVVVSMKITRVFAPQKIIITREQLSIWANLGYDEGVFDAGKQIIQNLIDLKMVKSLIF